MSIIWCGGEDMDFWGGANYPYISTDSKYRRTSYSRCSLYGDNLFCLTYPFSEVNDVWISSQVFLYNGTNSYHDALIFGLADSNNDATFNGFGVRKTDGKMVLRKCVSGTWSTLATEAGTSMAFGSVKKIDLYLKYAEEGIFRGYINRQLIVEYTGDLRITDCSGFKHLFLCSSTYSNYVQSSEFIVADEDTRSLNVKTLVPNAVGDVNDWNGSYTDIDEIDLSASDYIDSNIPNNVFTSNLTGLPTSSDWLVKAVRMSARTKGASSGQDTGVQIGIKTNNAFHYGNTIESSEWKTEEIIYNENPETLNNFTSEEIDDLQFAAKIIDVSE